MLIYEIQVEPVVDSKILTILDLIWNKKVWFWSGRACDKTFEIV